MTVPPRLLDGAVVVRWSFIDDRHRPTGYCTHRVNGVVVGPAAAVAIGRYADGVGCYLFGCDGDWAVVTDTFHDSMEAAFAQAEAEYEGVTATWQTVPWGDAGDARTHY